MGESVKSIVGVPTMKGIGGSFKDFGVGLLGGLLFLLSYQIFGGLGVIAAPLLAGSMIKGERGQILSTMSGFMLVAMALFGQSNANASNGSSNAGVM